MGKFSESVRQQVFKRQRGKCAFCGEDLNELLAETEMGRVEYHHIQPQNARGEDDADNCVALCTYSCSADKSKDGCHYHVHDHGRFAGAVALPRDFAYSHAHNDASRKAWILAWTKKYGRFEPR